MNCPSTEQWDLLSMNLVGQSDETGLLAHAQTCETCRGALKQARRDHATLLQFFEVFHRRHERLREELMAAVPAALPPRAHTRWRVHSWDGVRRVITNLNTTPRRVAAILASAACILLVVGVFLILGRGTVAFASVLERMRQARTMVCDFTTVTTTVFEVESRTEERTYHAKLSTYSDGTTQAGRIDQTDPPSTHWIFPDHSVSIDAEGKRTVTRFAEQPDPYARCESPEWWFGRLLKLTEAPDRELGTETLDGREVVGFEIAGWKLGYGARPTPGVDTTTAPTAVVRLWVDASTCLPLRIQVADVMATRMPGIFSMKVSMTWEHIAWDVPLDPQSFQPPPPVASAPVEETELGFLVQELALPSEEKLLDGLRAYPKQIKALLGERFADHLRQLMEQESPDNPEVARAGAVLGDILEVLGDGYPPQLDLSSFASSMLKLSIIGPSLERGPELAARARGDAEALARWDDERKAAAGNTEAAARLAERREAARKELEKKLEELGRSTVAMGAFYHQLLREDREPEYFGATVKPGDSDGVLMRWKLDDRHWRVIYGDLRAETVPMDQQPNGDVSPDSRPSQAPAPAARQNP
ncbi:MAG: hypothetical protein V2A79_13795 [Planctomycetota bacterium]